MLELREGVGIMVRVLLRGKPRKKKAYQERPHRGNDTGLKLERCEGGSTGGGGVGGRGFLAQVQQEVGHGDRGGGVLLWD